MMHAKTKSLLMLSLGFVLLGASVSVAAADKWSEEYPEAYSALVKILKKHPNTRDAFIDWTIDHPKVFREAMEWVGAKDDRTFADFVTVKKEKDQMDKGVEKLATLAKEWKEGMKEIRVWIHDYSKAALALPNHENALKYIKEKLKD